MSIRDTLLAAEHLVYRYPGREEPALDGVGLRLLRGEAVGLLGPNGSGKSTLIHLLSGLRRPQRGRVRHGRATPLTVAWVPQDCAFYPDLSCRENLRFFAGMLALSAGETLTRVEAALASCELHEFADRRARQCSGGVRRRLNLALALLQRPDVLLLDEPTVGVDPQSRAFLLNQIRALARDGAAVLYASHYMEEVAGLCTRILLLDRGRVLADGELATLLRGSGGTVPLPDLEALFMHHTRRSLSDGDGR